MPDHVPSPSSSDDRRWVRCDFCGAPMLAVHCKLKCEACGFVRDCSDP